MRNRIVLVVSLLFASAALTATSLSAAPADDECLAKPKGVAPAGKHWYYNTNRSTQRKCWYLGDTGEKTVAVAPRKQPAPASDADSSRPISMQPPAADARAELVEPRTEQRVAPVASLQAFTMPVTPSLAPATPVVPPQTEASQAAPDSVTTGSSMVVASRWPDPADTFASQRATTVSDPTPAPRTDNPSPAPAPTLVQESSAAVGNSGDMSFVPLAAAIFLVVICGAIVMFVASRRRSFDQHREMHAGSRRSLAGGANAARRDAAADAPEHIRLRDEIEQLLELGRQAQARRT